MKKRCTTDGTNKASPILEEDTLQILQNLVAKPWPSWVTNRNAAHWSFAFWDTSYHLRFPHWATFKNFWTDLLMKFWNSIETKAPVYGWIEGGWWVCMTESALGTEQMGMAKSYSWVIWFSHRQLGSSVVLQTANKKQPGSGRLYSGEKVWLMFLLWSHSLGRQQSGQV